MQQPDDKQDKGGRRYVFSAASKFFPLRIVPEQVFSKIWILHFWSFYENLRIWTSSDPLQENKKKIVFT